MNIKVDQLVKGAKVIVNPQNDRSRTLRVEGVIEAVLTKSSTHPHGILVKLKSGEIGRVKTLLQNSDKSLANSETLQPSVRVMIPNELILPKWLESENPYLSRDIRVLKEKLDRKYEPDAWRDIYHNEGVCGSLQEITKLIEKIVESIFKMPLFLLSEDPDILQLVYGRASNNQLQTYRFASSTDLISKLQFIFNDSRKKDRLVDMANYIDSDVGLLFERIANLDTAAITSLNSIRNYRNYLSHPQNDVLSQSKTRFIVDYSLVDFKEIYDLDVNLR